MYIMYIFDIVVDIIVTSECLQSNTIALALIAVMRACDRTYILDYIYIYGCLYCMLGNYNKYVKESK